jgi:4-diphosphocytidyl-2-C-methyl-D-erythritol kinase
VNFGLRIVGRRPDGLHELESVFLPLDLPDEVVLDVREASATQVELTVEGAAAGVPAGRANLAVRAAECFLEVAGRTAAVRVRLVKRVPAAAGLGGGSSDAGAVLCGMARLLPEAVGAESLAATALALGADVPFFLDPRPALVSGVGERCEALPAGWSGLILVLANPGVGLATARVYEAFDASPPPPSGGRLRPLLDRAGGPPAHEAGLGALLVNDLEPAAVRLCPAIERLRDGLREAGARAVALSGSGATVFGLFGTEPQAAAACRRLASGVWARVARTRESR